MDDLAREYQGRIKVTRFMAMTRFAEVTSPEIKERYDLTYIPTVILFDKGIEVERWRLVVMEDVYRYDLNKFLKARAMRALFQAPAPPGAR
jgi:thioredoxin-like negative regulator of GroEL